MIASTQQKTPTLSDAIQVFRELSKRFGELGAVVGAGWFESLYPTEAAAFGLPRHRQLALARIAVDAALESGDPDRYRVARAHQRELERPDVEALVRHLSRNDSPSSEEVTALIERARRL